MLELLLMLQLLTPPVVKNFLPSAGKRDTTQNYIVIHNDGGNFGASFTRRVLRIRGLAYHYFISRDGTIHQFMDLKNIAEHAGTSRWNGLTGWNKFSIGICLQGRDNMTYTNQQYESLKKLMTYINIRYPDSKEKPILTHATIAYPRFRKSDPGINFELWRIHHDTTYIPGR